MISPKNSPLYIAIAAERFKHFIDLRDQQPVEGEAWDQINTVAEAFIPTGMKGEALALFNRLINSSYEAICQEVETLSQTATV